MQGIVFQDRQICGAQFLWARDCKNSQNYNWAPKSGGNFYCKTDIGISSYMYVR